MQTITSRARRARVPAMPAVLALVVLALAFAPVGSAFAVFTKRVSVAANTVGTAAGFPVCYRDAVLADNPVGYWRLDETSGTVAADSKGSNPGTYVNGPVLGQSGALPDTVNNRAPSFDGVDDRVDVPASASLNVTSQITIEAWIYPTDTASVHPIVEYADSTRYGVHLWQYDNGTKLFANLMDTGGNGHWVMSGPVFTPNTWYHVALTYDGSVGVLYVNGNEVARAGLGAFTMSTNVPVNIGRRPVVGDSLENAVFAGKLDEVAIYPAALTAGKIRAHYNTGRCYKDAVLADAPAGYWRLGETSGTTAVDGMHGFHGTYTGGPTLNQPGALDGDGNAAAMFNGSSQYVRVPYASTLNPGQFTLEAWAKPTGGPGTWRAVASSYSEAPGEWGYGIWAANDNTWQVWISNGSGGQSHLSAPMTLNDWAHLVATYDGSTLRFYVDGIMAGSVAGTFSPNPSVPFGIGGATYDGTTWQESFPGSLDEVAVYPRALSAARIEAHYLAARSYQDTVLDSAPISYWRLGESAGATSAADVKGANPGTYANSPALGEPAALAGDSDTAAGFDGVDDYVDVPDSTAVDITGPLTIEAWIRVTAWDDYWQAIVTKGDSSYRLHRYLNTDNLSFTADGLSCADVQGTKNVNDGAWHHVVGVWDGSTKSTYVDGVLDTSCPATGTIATNGYDLAIGENFEQPGRNWDGSIDDVALYNRALTAPEVQLHYDSGRQ